MGPGHVSSSFRSRRSRGNTVSASIVGFALAMVVACAPASASSKAGASGRTDRPAPTGTAAQTTSPPSAPAPERQASVTTFSDYGFDVFRDEVYAVRWEMAAVGAAIAAIGLRDWDWGGSNFQFIEEGWFGSNTRHGGMDKIGHGFSTYVISDLLTDRIQANASNPAGAAITGAILGFGIMGLAETVDGFTGKHRFSREDIVANGAGALFALVRNSVPGLREKLDFRLLYTPASWEKPGITPDEFTIIPPYERQRYILALKGSGFESLRATPLRYVELQAGFEARGFGDRERELGYPIERTFYAGIGINLNEVIFGAGPYPNLNRYRDTTLAGLHARRSNTSRSRTRPLTQATPSRA